MQKRDAKNVGLASPFRERQAAEFLGQNIQLSISNIRTTGLEVEELRNQLHRRKRKIVDNLK